jgi:hypothetical protein
MLFELAKVRWQAVREQRSAALSQVEKSHR